MSFSKKLSYFVHFSVVIYSIMIILWHKKQVDEHKGIYPTIWHPLLYFTTWNGVSS